MQAGGCLCSIWICTGSTRRNKCWPLAWRSTSIPKESLSSNGLSVGLAPDPANRCSALRIYRIRKPLHPGPNSYVGLKSRSPASLNGVFPMKILALEFSSPQRSVALVMPSEVSGTFIENEAIETGSQSNKPFEMIVEVLRQAGLGRERVDRVVIGLGPGSYTGIRAAIALAQGWQLGRGVPLQGISSAECLAAQAQSEGILGRVGVAI